MIQLFDATNDRKWLTQAEALVAKMNDLFRDDEQGGYFMGSQSVSGAELPVRPKSIYDNSAPSGNSVALRVLSRLFYRTGNDEYLTLSEELLAAFSGQVQRSPTAFGYMMAAAQEMFGGETGQLQYAGRGHVKVSAKLAGGSDAGTKEANDNSPEHVRISLQIEDGWHVNAEKPIQDYLIGTKITRADGAELEGIEYPEALMRTLGFDRSQLALYEGAVDILVPVEQLMGEANDRDEETVLATIALNIDLQACDDTTCLAPETISMKVSTAGPGPWNPAMALAR